MSDIIRLPLHAAWISRGCSSNYLTFAIADVSIEASLFDTLALPTPSDWSNPGFSGESRAE